MISKIIHGNVNIILSKGFTNCQPCITSPKVNSSQSDFGKKCKTKTNQSMIHLFYVSNTGFMTTLCCRTCIGDTLYDFWSGGGENRFSRAGNFSQIHNLYLFFLVIEYIPIILKFINWPDGFRILWRMKYLDFRLGWPSNQYQTYKHTTFHGKLE